MNTPRFAIWGYAPETPLTDVLGEDLLATADTLASAMVKAQRVVELGCKKVRVTDSDGSSVQDLLMGSVNL